MDKLPDMPRQSALRSLVGLALLWACLVLLFKAHTMSEHPRRPEIKAVTAETAPVADNDPIAQ